MKNTLIGVVSYLPDTVNRQKRLNAVTMLMDKLKRTFPDTEIFCVAQCYHDDEYVDGITYEKFDKGISAAGARNVMLKKFYNSNYNWLVFMDDDCFIRDYYNALELIDILDENPNATTLDLITCIDPTKCGFKKGNLKNREVVEKYFTFSSYARQIPFAELRNIKKFYNKEVYFNETQDVNGVFLSEDFLWVKELVANGLRLRTCNQWIEDNNGMLYSMIVDVDFKANIQWHKDVFEYTKGYFKKLYNLPEKGFLNAFSKRYDVLKGVDKDSLNIPRKTPYTFKGRELHYIPRNVKTAVEEIDKATETTE